MDLNNKTKQPLMCPDGFPSKGKENPLLTLGNTKAALKLFMGMKPCSQREERSPCQGKGYSQPNGCHQSNQVSKQTKKVGSHVLVKKKKERKRGQKSREVYFQSISVYPSAVSKGPSSLLSTNPLSGIFWGLQIGSHVNLISLKR